MVHSGTGSATGQLLGYGLAMASTALVVLLASLASDGSPATPVAFVAAAALAALIAALVIALGAAQRRAQAAEWRLDDVVNGLGCSRESQPPPDFDPKLSESVKSIWTRRAPLRR